MPWAQLRQAQGLEGSSPGQRGVQPGDGDDEPGENRLCIQGKLTMF